MKRTLLFIAFVLTSLTMSAQGDLTVEDKLHSDCPSRTREENKPLPTIVLTKEGSILAVQLLNYESNCATAYFNITSTASGGSDGVPYSVNINVVTYLPDGEAMDCICPYSVSFTVRDIEANSFYLSCWWYDGLVTLEEGKPLVLEDIWGEATIDGMKYKLRKAMSRAILVDGSTQKGEARIPSELNYEGMVYSVTSIGESAFTNNMNLTKVFIPRTIMNTDLSKNVGIYSNPFYGCTSLQSIEVEDGNPAVCSVDGVLFNKEKTKFLSYPAGATQTSYTVPESVTWIEPLAFSYSQHLKEVTLTDNVTALGYSAFYECKSLEEVRLPSGLTILPNYLFGNCQHLKSVTIPQGVTFLGEKAFYGCTSLTTVTMPESITSTDYSVFEGCNSLESVSLSPKLRKIENNMFTNCSSLKEIIIPNGVIKIGSEAFKNCSALSSLDLPRSTNRLGYSIFAGCKLNSLYIRGVINPNWMSPSIFTDMDTQTELYVRPSEVEKYQAVYKGPVYPLPEVQEDPDYLPFVELNKQWHVVSSPTFSSCHLEKYWMSEEVEHDGKQYIQTYLIDDEKGTYKKEGLYREENRRVYKYDEIVGREIMLYDFSLKEGDTFTYELNRHYSANCKVLKQGWLEDGPDIVSSCTSNPDGTLDIKYRKLRTWTIALDNDPDEYNVDGVVATWVECVGTLDNMFTYTFMVGTMSCLAYIERKDYETDNEYLPFSLYQMYGPVYGCNLPTGKAELSEDGHHQLTYELEGDRLHIYGKVLTHGGPNNYAYFFEETTDDNSVRKLHFNIKEIEPLPDPKPDSDGMYLHPTDFYVPGFNPNRNYYVIDNQGVEHPVINKTPQMIYRPMIEDDKVWKVGSKKIKDNLVKLVGYYYFDGDTIIGGKTCKKMMFQQYVTPDYPEYDAVIRFPLLQYVGAWYEEDKKVYFCNEGSKQMDIKYDFSIEANDTLWYDTYYPCVIGPRQTGGIKGFKGIYRIVLTPQEEGPGSYNTTWLEGVGSNESPTKNVYYGYEYHLYFLMSCTVGDEVIYLNDEYEDGASPWEMDAKKHRFDFTHTIKTKPQTRGEEEEQSLYGEYNDQQLGINLDPLDEAYLVRITNESDKVVYEKTINAGNIVGLNIDISAYPEGRYTVTIENNGESFTGEFDTQTTGISDALRLNDKGEMIKNTIIYNLQGQRLNTLQRGLNIVNGRKILVK